MAIGLAKKCKELYDLHEQKKSAAANYSRAKSAAARPYHHYRLAIWGHSRVSIIAS
jgi:hypothetical protein